MNDITKLPVTTDDGFADDASDGRLIKGTRLKFGVDGKWSTREGGALPETLLVLNLLTVVQRWKDKQVIETFVDRPLTRHPHNADGFRTQAAAGIHDRRVDQLGEDGRHGCTGDEADRRAGDGADVI